MSDKREQAKQIIRQLRAPAIWGLLAVALGAFGLPAPIVAALAGALDMAPNLIDLAATSLALGGAAATAPRAVRRRSSRKGDLQP